MDEISISIGPVNTHNQVINAKAPIFLLSGFAMTAPRDHVYAPDKTSITSKYLPSRLGAHVKIKTPKKAINKPTIFFILGISFNKKKAINIPKGTSN